MSCPHPADRVVFEPGNHVPPYGWETYPGYYCLDCCEVLEETIMTYRDDPDFDRKYELENERDD